MSEKEKIHFATNPLETESDDWTLNPEQMLFMMQHHNLVTKAYAEDDIDTLRQLADTADYKTIFNDMSFDEAYDRYETIFLSKTAILKSILVNGL